jgi:hypothetical protein
LKLLLNVERVCLFLKMGMEHCHVRQRLVLHNYKGLESRIRAT